MEPTFLQFIVSATGTTGLAAFAIWLLNEARKDIQILIAQYALTNREDKLLLLKALDDNTKSDTLLNAKMDNLLGMAAKREEWINNEQRNRAAKSS